MSLARRSVRRLHERGVEPRGFDCRRRAHYFVLNHTDYVCEKGKRKFIWEKY